MKNIVSLFKLLRGLSHAVVVFIVSGKARVCVCVLLPQNPFRYHLETWPRYYSGLPLEAAAAVRGGDVTPSLLAASFSPKCLHAP